MLKKFLEKNLEAAEKYGTEEQQIDMESFIARVSHWTNELSDFMGGRRKLDHHTHHDPKDLTDAAIDSMVQITKIRREIGR